MLNDRDKVEHFLWWEPKSGKSIIWFNNWTKFGPLFKQQYNISTFYLLKDIDVFIRKNRWNYELIKNEIPEDIVQ